MRKTIAIIGATTKTGVAVAKELVTGPWFLLLLDEDVRLLGDLLNELKSIVPDAGTEALNCMVDACWEADIIILAASIDNKQNEIPAKLREVATGKTVISMRHSDEEISLEELHSLLPYSKVIRLELIQELFIHLNKV